MTISVRHPGIRVTTPRPRRVQLSTITTVPVSAVRTGGRTIVRAWRAPVAPRYSLSRFDLVFHRAAEDADEADAVARGDRRAGVLCLGLGLLVVAVGALAVAVLLRVILQLSGTILG